MPIVLNGSTGITDADGGTVLSTADIATQAEAEAGTLNTKVMTPLRVDQAIAANVWGYNSGNQTLTLDGSGTLAHSLGTTPTQYEVFLRCTTADLGWAVNDTVLAPRGSQIGAAHYGVTLGADATNIYFAIGSQIQIRSKGTTTSFGNITASSWRLVIRAR